MCTSLLAAIPWIQQPAFDFELEAGDGFGWSIAEVGDQTGDGVPELAVGCPFAYDPNAQSRVWIFDGAGGAVVAELGTRDADDHVGGWIANAGDVDLDGRDDILFLASKHRAELWSLTSGRLFEFESPTWHYRSAPMLGSPGAVDCDGVPDLLIGAWLHSGCDGRLLRRYDEAPVFANGFDSVSIVPDVDGDGVLDVAFVVLDLNCTRVVGLSATDGRELFRTSPLTRPMPTFEPQADGTYRQVERGESRLRVRVVPHLATDVDGDGERELLMHALGDAVAPMYVGTAPLTGERHSLPIGAGVGDRTVVWLGRSGPQGAVDALLGTEMFAILRRVDARTGQWRWETTLDDFDGHRSWGQVETVCEIHDVDGDGERDFACGVFQAESPGLPGHVNIVSGRDGVILRALCTRDALLQVGKRR